MVIDLIIQVHSKSYNEKRQILSKILTVFFFYLTIVLDSELVSAKDSVTAMGKPKNGNGKKADESGQKIVDADEIDPTSRAPFLAVFNFLPVKFAQCTGSVIADNWIISAAHCLGPKEKISLDDCGSTLRPQIKLECEETERGDLKIKIDSNAKSPKVFVGVRNLIKSMKHIHPLMVDYIIRPKNSYPGGSYGDYGGYDVILIKLKSRVSSVGLDIQVISLPIDDNFPDLGSAYIAGYGRYRRAPCEVGRLGPEKFEFCGVEKECTKASDKFNTAKCAIEFPYKKRNVKGCSYEPTPSATNPICQKFIKSESFQFPKDVDEVIIIKGSSGNDPKVASKCYRTMPGSYGWCGTIRDYSKFPEGDVNVEMDDGWGFCEKSCYPDMEVSLGGIARKKRVDVVSEEYCDTTLTNSGVTFQVKPLIMCVAFNFTYRTVFYEVTSKGFNQITEIPKEVLEDQLQRKNDYYITGTGTCGGDSGGPLFKVQQNPDTHKKEFVLIGTTSRGTGIRGNCGGLDNPTHYVRIKKFIKWIKSVVGSDNLTFASPGEPEDDEKKP